MGFTPSNGTFDVARVAVSGGLPPGDVFDLDLNHSFSVSWAIDRARGYVIFGLAYAPDPQARFADALSGIRYSAKSPGTRIIDITLSDGLNWKVMQIEVIVQANNPPTFSLVPTGAGAPLEDSAPGVFSGVITNISAGVNESKQQVSLQVDVFDHTLFSNVTIDNAGNLAYALWPDAYGIGEVRIYARDDGGTESGGSDKSAMAVLPITILPVNDPPSFIKGADISITVDSGPQKFDAWATHIAPGPQNESMETVQFEVTGFDPMLFTTPPALDAQGTLTFTPAPKASGQTTVTVAAIDNGGTAHGGTDRSLPQSFVISLLPNTPPTFVKGADQNILEDSGPQHINAWATQISAGTNEPLQQLIFQLSGFDKSLFAAGPSIDSQGDLAFTPAAHAHGTTMVSVQAVDDGGTANGGENQSLATSFAITIQAVNDPPTMDPVPTKYIGIGARTQTITLTGITPGPQENDQVITFRALSSDGLTRDLQVNYTTGANTATVTYSLNGIGTSAISIVMTDDGGTANGGVNQSTYTFDVVVDDSMQAIFVPTVFSPNGDNSNDTFRIRGSGIATLQLVVFDLSGRQLFHTDNVQFALEHGWDGTYKGSALPAGSYAWTIAGSLADGSELLINGRRYGQVLLVR